MGKWPKAAKNEDKPIKAIKFVKTNFFINKDLSIDFGYHIQYSKINFSEQLNEWGIQQSKELKEAGVPCIHYYTMSNSSQVKAIAKEVF